MKITFLQTGGTIDKQYPENHNNHGYNFAIGEPALTRILERIKPEFEVEILKVLRKDSLDITEVDRMAICDVAQNTQNNRIVITHGTDAIAQTAESLTKIEGKTIVLTGSKLPESFKDSDADFNLGMAIAVALSCEPGIYIVLGGNIKKL